MPCICVKIACFDNSFTSRLGGHGGFFWESSSVILGGRMSGLELLLASVWPAAAPRALTGAPTFCSDNPPSLKLGSGLSLIEFPKTYRDLASCSVVFFDWSWFFCCTGLPLNKVLASVACFINYDEVCEASFPLFSIYQLDEDVHCAHPDWAGISFDIFPCICLCPIWNGALLLPPAACAGCYQHDANDPFYSY